MDVRCERCRAQYVVDDARVPEAGVKVACTQCGHGFLLRKKILAVTVPLKGGDTDVPIPIADLASQGGAAEAPGAEASPRSEWRLRQRGGAVFPFRELSTLQRWIVERKAARDDEVAAAGEGDNWRRLADIPELQSFFKLLEKAQRRAESNQEVAVDAPPARPRSGLEDPAWASGPAPPTRRVTRSALRPPPRRRRVVWVALLVLGLLGVAATTVYLRRKAEVDAAVHAANEAAAATAALAAAKPRPVAAPPPITKSIPEPKPEPEREPPSGPVPEASPAPPPSAAAAEPAPAAPAGSPVTTSQAEPASAIPADPPQAAPQPPRREDAASALRGVLARAREQRDRGRCEAALDLYGQALALDGRNAAALSGRGSCYLDLSRYVQAEASFEGALDLDPRNAEALYGMAETYRYMGRKGDAVAFYEKFLAVRPTGDDAAAARRLISQLKE
jgi:predicted Zn finger-like uncharacterized protein